MGLEEQERTTSGTFRIPDRVLDAMRKEARANMTSLNTLVNQILTAHYYQDFPEVKSPFMLTTKPVFKAVLSHLTEEELRQIARTEGVDVVRSMLLARHDDVTSDEVADFYRDFARRNSLGRFEDVLEGGRRIITFRHDLGRKESVLVGETMASMFMTCEQEVKLTIFDDACICEIWPRDTK